MASKTKFASQMDDELLRALRAHARESGRSISRVLGDAVAEYLDRRRVRPAFAEAADAVMDEHAELLARLAK